MIGKLTGLIDCVFKDHVILDVSGVGYIVYCSTKTLSHLPHVGEKASLLIEMNVREDAMQLFGFLEPEEKRWFKELQSVKGVGMRMALSVLSILTSTQLYHALASQDVQALNMVPGIGKKLAERIINELKDKYQLEGELIPSSTSIETSAASTDSSRIQDALSALTHLGYTRSDAYSVLTRIVVHQPELSVENLIKEGLKALSRTMA